MKIVEFYFKLIAKKVMKFSKKTVAIKIPKSFQFLFFLINGGILGLIVLLLQRFIDLELEQTTEYHQLISSIFAISPIIVINFFSQKKIIFKRNGSFIKFLAINFLLMLFVSLTSELFNKYNLFNYKELNLNFLIAALIFAPISFFLKKYFIFHL
jgi:hypothetical protein